MAFKEIGSAAPWGAPVLVSEIIEGSRQLTELDSVMLTTGATGTGGFVTTALGNNLIFGHVKSIVTNYGVGVETDGSTGAATGSFAGTFTAPSTNTTVAKNRAIVDISKYTKYSADPDATVNTTTGSGVLGYHTDVVDEDSTDEDTAATTSAQYFIWGLDPSDSGNQVVSIYESVVFGI